MSICTAQERKAAFEQVFMTHRWGNPANSGRKNEKGDKGTCTVCKKEHSVNIKK